MVGGLMRRATIPTRVAILLISVAVQPLISQAARARLITPDVSGQREQFLVNAKIVARKAIGEGITHTTRITLTDGKLTHDAHVQTIDIYKAEYRTKEFVEKNFRDSYKYNIAAYRVAKMLNLDMMPPCVYREIDGQPASVCWWVDNVQFDELGRREKKVEPADGEDWTRQLNLVRVFDQLIDNTDRNQGNLLIDKDWKLWMIDHSRAFRVTTVLRRPEILKRVSTQMLEAMRGMTLAQCMAELRPYLTEDEIRTMMVRRDLLLKFFADAVSEKGADAVFTDLPRKTPNVTIP
jgi:hypothetical protein